MKIILTTDVAIKLLACSRATLPNEFSGFGFVRITPDKNFEVYDFVPLDVGSGVWTEIGGKLILPLLERKDAANMKVWIHQHPVGNGVPGHHNWSGTDHNTCLHEPLGGHPDMVKWSLAIVLTPHGWVGRYDNHVKHKTEHLEVEPNIARFHQEMSDVVASKVDEKKQTLASICMAMEEVINNVDADTLAELKLSEEELWEMLSKKVNWGGNVPVTYEEWYLDGEDALIAGEQAGNVEYPDYRNFTYGTQSSFHRMSDEEIANT